MAQATSTRALARGPVTGTATHLDVKRKRVPFFVGLYRSALGKKYIMAITGVALMGFVLIHMVGNLKMYLGKDASGVYDIDRYGEFLRELLVPLAPRTVVLWLLRVGLIAAFVLHIHAAYSLTVMNRRARTTRYQSPRDYIAANFASRTMRWTGIIFFLFLVWHLADLSWGWVNPHFVRGEVYRNIDASLSRWPVAILYIVGNLALGVHLFHGSWSLFQSLGLNNPRFNIWRRWFAIGFSALIVVGNVSFPIAVLAGIVKV
jgi:succinate dehydrogenase / fumarate reductase, cytochrome b subunit